MNTTTETLSERFSAQVRAHLAFRRQTVADLSAAVGISEATLYRRLNEGRRWPLDQSAAVAAHFGYANPIEMVSGGIPETAA